MAKRIKSDEFVLSPVGDSGTLQPWVIEQCLGTEITEFEAEIVLQDIRKIVKAIHRNDFRFLEAERIAFSKWEDELRARGFVLQGGSGVLPQTRQMQKLLLFGGPDSVEIVNAWGPYRKYVEHEHIQWALSFCQRLEAQIAYGLMSTVDYAACLTRSNFVASIQEQLAYFRKRVKEDGLDPEKFLEIGFAPNHEGLVQSSAVAQQARAAVGLSIS